MHIAMLRIMPVRSCLNDFRHVSGEAIGREWRLVNTSFGLNSILTGGRSVVVSRVV